MSEKLIVQHCSPTLAGMKTGNMFTCAFSNENEMRDSVRSWNRILVKKGLRVIPLRFRNNRALIYIYRPNRLSRDLEDGTASRLLSELGYVSEIPEHCILHLKKRLTGSDEFPHEIGLFLGYPPEDVCGFIKNKADGYKCVGNWKVYGDVAVAEKLFKKYEKCTAAYCAQLERGRPIDQLTVAG